MIQFEILSNSASSDTGLVDHPPLLDLSDTLQVYGLEVRVTRLQHQEENEINLAMGQFGQGVRAAGKAIKNLRPETHIRGLLAWQRQLANRQDRALHLKLDNLRATNGAALLLEPVLKAGQKAFLDGLSPEQMTLLTAQADLSFSKIPPTFQKNPPLKKEMLERAQRSTGFVGLLGQIAKLDFIPRPLAERFGLIFQNRDAAAIAKLSEAEVINAGLVADYHTRYQQLLEQFFGLLTQKETNTELGPLFDLLTQRISLVELKLRLASFVLEDRRELLADKRAMLHELRIGLTQLAENQPAFKERFTALFLRVRLYADPGLYEGMVLLPPCRVEELEVVAALRRQWMGLAKILGPGKGGPPPAEAQLRWYEMIVGLTFAGDYTNPRRPEHLPDKTRASRRLLALMAMKNYDITQIRALNPKLPVRGVASGLAAKYPLEREEFSALLARLEAQLFPVGAMARQLAHALAAHFKDREQQLQTRQKQLFFSKGYPLAGLTNYLMGGHPGSVPEREGFLEAGRLMGLSLLPDPQALLDKRAAPQAQKTVAAEVQMEGVIELFGQPQTGLFPLATPPATLAEAWHFLYGRQVALLVRRHIANRLESLFKQHGDRLFEAIYHHLSWEKGLSLSRNQLGRLLFSGGVFDKARLLEFGFNTKNIQLYNRDGNPLLKARPQTPPPEQPGPFDSPVAQAQYAGALKDFSGLLMAYKKAEPPADKSPPPLAAALNGLALRGRYNLRHEGARAPLSQTAEANQLWEILLAIIRANHQALLPEGDRAGEGATFQLPMPLAYLSLLRDTQAVKMGEETLLFRLEPALHPDPELLDPASRLLAQKLSARLNGQEGGAGGLPQALNLLQQHDRHWRALTIQSSLALLDQMLRHTVFALAKPAPPRLEDLAKLPPQQLLMLGASSSDQGRFSKIYPRPEEREVFATLSELASWLIRLPRMKDELENYRGQIEAILKVAATFNLTAWDAPYMTRYTQNMRELDECLNLLPERLTQGQVASIEAKAQEISQQLREIFAQESQLRMRDRWMNRVLMRLKIHHPEIRPQFVDGLYEGGVPVAAPEEEGANARQEKTQPDKARPDKPQEHQTFTARLKNVIALRERLENKRVIVISPSPTQKALTLGLVENLYRMKGLFLPIFVDLSGCEVFEDDLRARVAPDRFFNLLKR